MPEIASNITIDKNVGRLLINGEEFPYYVGDSISVDGLTGRHVTEVNISILTKRVTVIPLKGDEESSDA
jgi:hypothetical protein